MTIASSGRSAEPGPRGGKRKNDPSKNTRKRGRKLDESARTIIEKYLLASVPLTIDGESRQAPAIEAIVLQLLKKTMAGNVRAARVLKKYKEFAFQNMERKIDLTFVESAYTHA